MSRGLVAAARKWRAVGAIVMGTRGKRPIIKDWQRLSAEEHMRLIERAVPQQLALRMGKQPSGRTFFAIDVDPSKGGDESMRVLQKKYGELPPTFRQETGGGGYHLMFEWPLCAKEICPTVSVGKLASGVDIRGQRGLIVIAPSVHESGKRYRVTNWGYTDKTVLSPPLVTREWFRLLLDTHPPKSSEKVGEGGKVEHSVGRIESPRDKSSVEDRARRYIAKMEPAISGSGGHNAAWAVAQVLVRGFSLERNAALKLFREYSARCQPPWSEREIAHKIDSALSRSKLEFGFLLRKGRDGKLA